MKILSAANARDWEAATLRGDAEEDHLMRIAVEGLFQFIHTRFRQEQVLILAGKGNNGNDALWLGYRLRTEGRAVHSLLSHSPHERVSTGRREIQEMENAGVVWPQHPDALDPLAPPTLIIDGLLGQGVRGNPRGVSAEIIEWTLASVRPCDTICSIDVPSGFDLESGRPGSPCLHAHTTLTIGTAKEEILADAALPAIGRLHGIPIPLKAPGPEAQGDFIDLQFVRQAIRPLSAGTYKHRQGSVAVWAGSPGMAGAAILTCRAALRAGAGLVRCFCHPDIYPLLATATPEVMVESLPPAEPLPDNALEADAIIAGPGIGLDDLAWNRLHHLIQHRSGPLVLDADALRLLADHPDVLSQLSDETILTPHWGEFRALQPEAPQDRFEAARTWMASRHQACLVLKGPHTFTAQPGSGLTANGSGNPGMASAGMGDVLAGILGGLCASGYPPSLAAPLGVYWHGDAADHAIRESGEPSLIASDVVDALGGAWHAYGVA